MNEISSEKISKFAELLNEAECVWLGSGAGLSASADPRFNYMDEEAFAKSFPSMLQYGFKRKMDLMGFGIVPPDLQWGYYLPHAKEVRFTPKKDIKYPVYSYLWDIIRKTDRQTITTFLV